MAKSKWTLNTANGGRRLQRRVKHCKMTVIDAGPKQKVFDVSCGVFHKRGTVKTIAAAKSSALRTAKRLNHKLRGKRIVAGNTGF